MRYAAIPVLVAEGEVRVKEASIEKGSLDSLEGDVCGVGRVGELGIILLRRFDVDACREAFEEVGDAKRDKVLRKVDLRFGGVES